MTADGAVWLSIEELGRRYQARDLSPVEVTRALLDRIGKVNGVLKSFVLVLDGSALREAQDPRAATGRERSTARSTGSPSP